MAVENNAPTRPGDAGMYDPHNAKAEDRSETLRVTLITVGYLAGLAALVVGVVLLG
jgi:hypothetical protein